MIRRLFFFCALVPIVLAFGAARSFTAPMIGRVGAATASIAVSPDPPQVGINTVIVTLSGIAPAALSQTTVRYATMMPSMNMSGPSGEAARVPGRSDAWQFKVPFGTAAAWTLRVQCTGAVSGSFDANLDVTQAARAPATRPAGSTTGSMNAASASPVAMPDSTGAWQRATFALLVVMLVGALAFRRYPRATTLVMLVAASAAIVAIAFLQSRGNSPAEGMSSTQSAQGGAPVPVTFATVRGGSSGTIVAAPASVQPYLVQNIVVRERGLLTDFSAYTGNRLSAGQIVARLDEPELQSNAKAAASAAEAAQSERESAQYDAVATQADVAAKRQQLAYWKTEIAREKSLVDQGAVSVQEYQQEKVQAAAARSGYDAARAKLAGANATIATARAQAAQAVSSARSQSLTAGYTNVIVPDDSIVMKRLVDPGVYVEAGTPILEVAVINRLRVQAQVSQRDLHGVHVGTPVDISFADGNVVHGRISSVSPVADPNTHTAIAEAIVPNPGDRYQPGAFVHTTLHAQALNPSHSFTVPSSAIVGGATAAVWTERDGAAHRVPVTVVSDDGTTAQVTGPLRAGSHVVVAGAQDVEEGQPIVQSGS